MKPKLEDLTPENTAVLIIDMQEDGLGFCEKNTARKIIKNQLSVLYKCKVKNIFCVVAEHYHRPTIEEISLRVNEVPRNYTFGKMHQNAFKETNLFEKSIKEKIKFLFLMGIYKSRCVFNTAEGIPNFEKIGFATSSDVIADTEIDAKVLTFSDDWYAKNGIYRPSYRDFPIFR